MTRSSRLIFNKSDINYKNKNQYTKNTKVLWMPISVGQDYHELDKLLESMKLIIRNFTHITLIKVIIVDLAQKYHLAIKNNTSPEKMLGQSQKQGLAWKQSYAYLIKTKFKNITVEFNTWDASLYHDNYNQARQQIDNLYNEKIYFKKLLETDVLEFELRHFKRERRYFTDNEKEYCRECIKEECAILMLWNKDLVSPDYSFIFYPKKIPKAMTFVRENFTNFLFVFAEFAKSKRNHSLIFQPRKSSLNLQEDTEPPVKYRKFSH